MVQHQIGDEVFIRTGIQIVDKDGNQLGDKVPAGASAEVLLVNEDGTVRCNIAWSAWPFVKIVNVPSGDIVTPKVRAAEQRVKDGLNRGDYQAARDALEVLDRLKAE